MAPVRAGTARPLWSVLIPTFNCGPYLERALTAVLGQDPGREAMEIVVVDDCSTEDDPAEVVERIGQGRVQLLRQSENLGKVRNYQAGLRASRGYLIHQLHGDDLIGGGFYQSMQDCFERHPTAGAFFCETQYIDENDSVTGQTGRELEGSGLLKEWLEKIYVRQRIQSPSVVLRREVYEQLGGFDQRLTAFEDWEMWVRAATQFEFGFNTRCTAQYRVFSANTSHKSIIKGERPRLLRRALRVMDTYVPDVVRRKLGPARAREAAYYLTRCLPVAVRHRRPLAWLRLCFHIVSYSRHPRVWYHAFLFTCRVRRQASGTG